MMTMMHDNLFTPDVITLDQVRWFILSANRDLRQFFAPNTFDMTRSPNRPVALSAGIHFCRGSSLARMEGQGASRPW